jgi:hypothetical protein
LEARDQMHKLGIIIQGPEPLNTKAVDLAPWSISPGQVASYLMFFEKIGYFGGVRERAFFNIGGNLWKLQLPNDPAFENEEKPLVACFFAKYEDETVVDAIVEKIAEGFTSAPNEQWICHPRIVAEVADRDHPFEPMIDVEFFEGLFCPPDNVAIDEVLDFREKRASEREAFFDALYEASETVCVNGRIVSVSLDVKRLKTALDDLNKSAADRWIDGVRRSFKFGIRPNQTILGSLAAAIFAHQATGNLGASVLTALYGSVEFSVDLTPRIERHDDFTRAMTFAWTARKRFERP